MTVTTTGRSLREKMLIGGEWIDSADGRTFDVETPARRGSVIAQVPRAGAEDVDRAVKAAAAAFPSWRSVAPRDRGRILARIADDVEAAIEDLARTLAAETGNAIRTQARPEAKTVADVFRYFGGLGGELKGETVPLGETMFSYTRREPFGVVAAIVPWNVPILIAAWKIAPALIAGNTVVLKPSANAPLAALALARICAKHLPTGVLNVVTGTGDEVGTPLAVHPLVAKISFTGATDTGKAILRLAADRIIPVTLELGGKSPQILFPDADNEKTADGVIAAMRFARQGQSCTAGSRLFLHKAVFDSFLDKLATKLGKLKVGDPLEETNDMGAIVSRQQFDRVVGFIDEGSTSKAHGRSSAGCPRKKARSPRAITSSRRSSRTSGTIGGSPARRSLARCLSRSHGTIPRMRCAWRTTPTTASRRTSGARTSVARFVPRIPSTRAGSRSTRASVRS
jgi:acyl-CoA reductase-like NAD-dependent aldehyde dehydrogenase